MISCSREMSVESGNALKQSQGRGTQTSRLLGIRREYDLNLLFNRFDQTPALPPAQSSQPPLLQYVPLHYPGEQSVEEDEVEEGYGSRRDQLQAPQVLYRPAVQDCGVHLQHTLEQLVLICLRPLVGPFYGPTPVCISTWHQWG